MMRRIFLLAAFAAATLPGVPAGAQEASKKLQEQAQKAVEINSAALEVRADQHFLGGEWAQALPMYKKLAEMFKNEPDRLGPVEERIRVCERNIAKLAKVSPSAAATPTAVPAAGSVVPNAAPPTAEQRKPHPVPKDGQVLDLTIKDLGNFDYDQEKGGNIPEDVKRLSGRPVRVRGFMIPMDQADNITKFALVPDLFACCFGQPPQIQHMVVANCPEGKAVGYSPDEILVEGKLNVEEKKDDGYIISIFEVTVTSVKAAPR
jgi:hypothetical protein